jgi:hypothetical protein
MKPSLSAFLALAVPLLAGALPAFAQAPALKEAPRIKSVFPPGVRRGSATGITLVGENLEPGSRLLVSGEGVEATVTGVATTTVTPPKEGESPAKDAPAPKEETSMVIQLQVAADAAPGPRELRVLGPNGASNAARVTIGTLPEIAEKEPNNKPEEAQPLTDLPVTVNGRIDALGDVDRFRFHAGVGETWVFDLGAASHHSALTGFMTLRDAADQELASEMETLGQDPRLIHTFEKAGDYTIAVRDLEYRGDPSATYRLSIGQLPAVTRVLPLGLPRGQTTTLQLAGVNLGGMATMAVTVPADYARDTMTVVAKTPSGETPVKLAVSSLPEWVETEPNDDRARATHLPSLPGAVSGSIGHPGDVDLYAFHAPAGQKLTFDLFARRLNSRLDSFMRLTDATGKELASNDDAVGKDSRLEWSPPAAGEYFVQVSDIAGDGGDDYGYRLEVTPTPAPDFKLTVTPDVTNIGPGDSEVLTVRAERLNGFDGDIALKVEDLPAGLAASPAALPKGQDTAPITLTAAPAAAKQGFPFHVSGMASIGGKSVVRVAEPMESSEDERQRPTLLEVAGVGAPGPYTVSTEPRQVTIAPGATATVKVKVTRRADAPDAKGEVNLDVQFLPEGIEVKAPAIPADKSEGTVELKATDKLEPRAQSFVIRARTKERTRPAPALALVVTPKPPAK